MFVYVFIDYLRVQCIINHMSVYIFKEYLRVQRVLFPDRPGTATVQSLGRGSKMAAGRQTHCHE